ncbi:hypothetical protein QQF64_022481 [Cirrhinus molitorella]|uniref:Prion protein n=1 Tax=Cirrhinus molitorella TaxID=172907 RepID=A0ABR3L3W9_9TELE
MGMAPSYKSKGFGKQAIMAAGAGAVAGMALGYGLGSFPRPRFHFHSPQEEYYYNHYMYRRYGQTPPDSNVNGNTNSQGGSTGNAGSASAGQGNVNPHNIFENPPPQSYDSYMDKCVKRTDLLREKPEGRSRRSADFVEAQAAEVGEVPTGAQENATSNNSTAERDASENSSFVTSHPPETPNQPQKQTQGRNTEADDDDDTVSIVEIGYPALIEQMKARRCVELYMVYAEQHAEKQVQDRSNADVRISNGSGDLPGPCGHGFMLLFASILSLIFSSLLH